MRLTAVVVFTAILWCDSIGTAAACPDTALARIRKLNRRAAELYVNYDFDVARTFLKSALKLAESKNCGKNRMTARTLMLLGVVEFAGFKNRQAARAAWRRALAVWPRSIIPPRLASPALIRFFREVKQTNAPTPLAPGRAPGASGTATSRAPPAAPVHRRVRRGGCACNVESPHCPGGPLPYVLLLVGFGLFNRRRSRR